MTKTTKPKKKPTDRFKPKTAKQMKAEGEEIKLLQRRSFTTSVRSTERLSTLHDNFTSLLQAASCESDLRNLNGVFILFAEMLLILKQIDLRLMTPHQPFVEKTLRSLLFRFKTIVGSSSFFGANIVFLMESTNSLAIMVAILQGEGKLGVDFVYTEFTVYLSKATSILNGVEQDLILAGLGSDLLDRIENAVNGEKIFQTMTACINNTRDEEEEEEE